MKIELDQRLSPFKTQGPDDQPLYGRVLAHLIEIIESDFAHDERFFTERDLIAKFGVSQPTIRRAMQELVDRGLLRRHVGRGSFVQKFKPTRLVGVIAPQCHSMILIQQINAVADLCRQFDCNLRVHHIQKGESVRDMARSLKANPHDERMLLIGHTVENAWTLFDELEHRGFKTVCSSPYISGYPGSNVSIDTNVGVYIALNHLVNLGHERIAFIINEPVDLISIRVRLEALRKEVADRGLEHCTFIDCHTPLWANSFDAAFAAMDKIMALKPMPTAVVPLSGIGAWAVLRYAGKYALRLPDLFSVFAFDDIPGAENLYPALSAISVEREAQSFAMLDLLWSDHAKPRQITLSPQLIIRESTVPVPQNESTPPRAAQTNRRRVSQ